MIPPYVEHLPVESRSHLEELFRKLGYVVPIQIPTIGEIRRAQIRETMTTREALEMQIATNNNKKLTMATETEEMLAGLVNAAGVGNRGCDLTKLQQREETVVNNTICCTVLRAETEFIQKLLAENFPGQN